jgi:hypothetical protein
VVSNGRALILSASKIFRTERNEVIRGDKYLGEEILKNN